MWNHFKKTADTNKAICMYCDKVLRTGGNTTNLLDHLRRIHKNIDVAQKDSQPTQLDTFVVKASEYPSGSKTKEDLDKKVMRMIALDVQPNSIVNDQGFRDLMHTMDLRYKLPSKTYLRDVSLPKAYTELKAQLQQELKAVKYASVTTDGWTSRANDGYLTITCHFISQDFKLTSAVLSTTTLVTPTNHTSNNIAESVKLVLNEWDLYQKVTSIVTDNDATMKKACELLEIRHFPCFAHTINLLAKDILKMDILSPLLTKCKSIVAFMKRSSSAMAKFKNAQDVEPALSLVQEVPTRWNSAFQMMERIFLTNDALSTALLATPRAPVPFSADDIEVMNSSFIVVCCCVLLIRRRKRFRAESIPPFHW